MAIGYVNGAAATGSTGTTLSVNRPPSTVADYVLLIQVFQKNTGAITLPAGFTELATGVNSNSTSRMTVGYKVATGSEPSSYSITKVSGAATAATITSYSGCNPDQPIDAQGTLNGSSPLGYAINNDGITTVTNAAAAIACAGTDVGGGWYTTPAGWTYFIGYSPTGFSNQFLSQSPATPTTIGSFAHDSYNQGRGVSYTVALREASQSINTGEGDAVAGAASVAVTAEVASGVAGTGSPQAASASVAATAAVVKTGTGAVNALAAAVSVAAALVKTAAGSPTAGQATADGTGEVSKTAAVALQASRATSNGVGGADTIIGGTGAPAAERATSDASGAIGRDATGSPQADIASASAAGTIGRFATGSPQASPPTIEVGAGVGTTASPTHLAAGQATASGVAEVVKTGAGVVQASQAFATTTAEVIKTGAGAVSAGSAEASGTAEVIKTASVEVSAEPAGTAAVAFKGAVVYAALVASVATSVGEGLRTVKGSGSAMATSATAYGYNWGNQGQAGGAWSPQAGAGGVWTEQGPASDGWLP